MTPPHLSAQTRQTDRQTETEREEREEMASPTPFSTTRLSVTPISSRTQRGGAEGLCVLKAASTATVVPLPLIGSKVLRLNGLHSLSRSTTRLALGDGG